MICALCIAVSAVLQTVFASLETNCAFYLSVLICTMCCPIEYGVFCAVILPLVALIESEIPAAALLPAEIGKCLVFAVSSKLLLEKIKKGAMYDRLYLCLVVSVCIGQAVGGLLCAALLCSSLNSAIMFVVEELVSAIPEIIALFALLAGIVPVLKTAGVLEQGLFDRNSKPTSADGKLPDDTPAPD